MWVIVASLFLGMVGALATRAATHGLAAGAERDPHVYWVLGLGGLVPAWLLVFLVLLGPTPTPRKELISAVAWILSTAAALVGAIATEGWLRRAGEATTVRPPAYYWWLGLLGFAPAWAIALVGHALRTFQAQ